MIQSMVLRTVMPRRRSSRLFSAAFQAVRAPSIDSGAKRNSWRAVAHCLLLPEALHHLHQDQIPDRDRRDAEQAIDSHHL